MISAAGNRDSDFFVAGGTLHKDAPCYVPRSADEALHTAVRNGEYAYVLTSRQMGKSSLMLRVTNRLREEGIAVVLLDLTRFGAHNISPDQWYAGMLSEIGRALDLRSPVLAYWKQENALPAAQRFFGALTDILLRKMSGPLVLFFDEVDVVRSLPFCADEFFAGIRECYNRRTEDPEMCRLIFGLFGVAAPSQLIQDSRMTPFNIGVRVELGDFTFPDALVLAEGLGPNGQEQLKRVFHWTAGHPYLTLKLCRALADDPTAHRPSDVDRLAHRLYFTPASRETDDNLLFVRRWLLDGGADVATLLDLYRRVREGKRIENDSANPLIEILRLSGIVAPGERHLMVRNRIYQRVFDPEWIVDHMPDAELRRQKAAFRRGVARTAWVSGSVALALGCLSVYAFSEKSRADRMTAEAQAEAQTAHAREKQAVRLAAQVTDLARQLSRSQASAKEAAALRRRLEKLTATPTPAPTPSPVVAVTPPTPSPTPRVVAAVTRPRPTPTPHPLVRLSAVRSLPRPTPTPAPAPIPSASESPRETPTPAPSTTDDPLPSSGIAPSHPALVAQPDTPAELIRRPPMILPPRLQRMVYRGNATFNVTVGPGGKHLAVLTQGTDLPALDRYLKYYMSLTRWKAATLNGKPVPTRVEFTLPIDLPRRPRTGSAPEPAP
ncbi:MAG: AAA-like domain-containing protein [Capsulimonadales bacterium]|nr:AAA-like domain-containing protein [Capsulimonadales bacterium]